MTGNLFGIQLISILFAIFMLYVTFIHYKRSNINKAEAYTWFICWTAFIYLAINPNILKPIMNEIYVARAMDLLMIGAFMILTYLGFQNHIGVKSLQKDITQIISKRAIKRAKKSTK